MNQLAKSRMEEGHSGAVVRFAHQARLPGRIAWTNHRYPTIDSSKLRRGERSAHEWFDLFYSDVEALQTCADVRCIGGGLAVTSFNTTAAFAAYKEAASKLISDWLSNKAWDDLGKAH